MNLDPLTIILFLIFFVLPIVNNIFRRGRGGQGGQGQRGGQGRPQGRPTAQRQERSDDRTTTADTSQGSGSAGDEFTRRLEEARRRVQEAMGGGSGEQGRDQPQRGSRGGSQSERESSGDLFPRLDEERQARSQGSRSQQGRASQQGRGLEGGRARQPSQSLGREGMSRQRPASQQGTMSKQSSVDRTELGDAPPLRVQRLRPRRGSKIDESRGVLEFDRRSVLQGIIWREILDEPLSKRKRRERL